MRNIDTLRLVLATAVMVLAASGCGTMGSSGGGGGGGSSSGRLGPNGDGGTGAPSQGESPDAPRR